MFLTTGLLCCGRRGGGLALVPNSVICYLYRKRCENVFYQSADKNCQLHVYLFHWLAGGVDRHCLYVPLAPGNVKKPIEVLTFCDEKTE